MYDVVVMLYEYGFQNNILLYQQIIWKMFPF